MKIEDRVKELLDIAIKIGDGEMPEYQCNETYTSGAYDLLLLNTSNSIDSFNLIQALCDYYPNINKNHIEAYLGLLVQAAQSAKTTELPQNMEKIIISNISYSGAKELAEWYRIKV